MHLLAIVAHPDDAAIFCGGTLAKHADAGDDVTIVYLTRGELGGTGPSREDLAATRQAEAERGAAELGADAAFLDFQDGRVTDSLEHRHRLVEALRAHAPDLVITHYHDDLHPDHRATARLVTDAYYMASLPLLETDAPPCDPDNVYSVGKPSSSFEPSFVVDITGYQDAKEAAIRRHESQLDWLESHGGIDAEFTGLVADARASARVLGRETGVEYAEGFTRLHEHAAAYLE